MKSELNNFFTKALIVATVIFLLLVGTMAYFKVRMHAIERREKALQAESEYRGSLTNLLATSAKSFFDGFTLGIFAEEGIFTEYKKADRWIVAAEREHAENVTAFEQCWNGYNSCRSGRNWACLFLVIFLIGYFATKEKEEEAKQA